VRKAFGASSRDLVGQFVVENVVLTVIGGVLAAFAAVLVLAVVNRAGVIPYAQLALNVRVLLWGCAFALFFGVLSGAWPAYRMSRLHPVDALKGAMR
jgi:putative ABC transport system permease protein